MSRVTLPTKQCQVPVELKVQRRWCLVQVRPGSVEGDWIKDRYYAPDGSIVRNNDSRNWCTYEEIRKHVNHAQCVYAVFIFQKGDNFVFLDPDRAFRSDGKPRPFVKWLIETFRGTYMELSLSGNGVHIIVIGSISQTVAPKFPEEGDTEGKPPALDVFHNTNRFCIMTGKLLEEDGSLIIAENQKGLDWLQKKWGGVEYIEIGDVSQDWLWNGKTKLIKNKKLEKIYKKLPAGMRDLHKAREQSRTYSENPNPSELQYAFWSALCELVRGDKALIDYCYMMSPVSRLESSQMADKGIRRVYRATGITKVVRLWEEKERRLRVDMESWCYVTYPGCFVHRVTGERLEKGKLNNKYSPIHQHGAKSAFVKFMQNDNFLKGDRILFNPGADELHEYPGFPGLNLNTWKKPIISAARGDMQPWLDLVECLIPEKTQRFWFLNWVAGCVRHLKVAYMPIIVGVQGSGKDSMLVPLVKYLGRYASDNVKASVIMSDKQDWLWEMEMCVIQELKAFKWNDFNNTLKTYVSTPPDSLEINIKWGGIFKVLNVCNFCAFSNYKNAIRLEPGDRRALVIYSDAPPMADWLKEKEMVSFQNYLRKPETLVALEHWAKDFGDVTTHPSAEQLNNEHKRELYKLARSSVGEMIQMAIEEKIPPFHKDMLKVSTFLKWVRDESKGRAWTWARLKDLLDREGVQIAVRERVHSRKHGSAQFTVAIVRNHKKWTPAKATDVIDYVNSV